MQAAAASSMVRAPRRAAAVEPQLYCSTRPGAGCTFSFQFYIRVLSSPQEPATYLSVLNKRSLPTSTPPPLPRLSSDPSGSEPLRLGLELGRILWRLDASGCGGLKCQSLVASPSLSATGRELVGIGGWATGSVRAACSTQKIQVVECWDCFAGWGSPSRSLVISSDLVAFSHGQISLLPSNFRLLSSSCLHQPDAILSNEHHGSS